MLFATQELIAQGLAVAIFSAAGIAIGYRCLMRNGTTEEGRMKTTQQLRDEYDALYDETEEHAEKYEHALRRAILDSVKASEGEKFAEAILSTYKRRLMFERARRASNDARELWLARARNE